MGKNDKGGVNIDPQQSYLTRPAPPQPYEPQADWRQHHDAEIIQCTIDTGVTMSEALEKILLCIGAFVIGVVATLAITVWVFSL